jgi:hypothetical protein
MYSFAADGDGHQSQRFMSAHFAFLFSIKWQICHLIRSQRRQPRHIAAPCVSMSSVASHAFTGSVPSWYASSARHREYQRGTGRGKTGNEAGPVFNNEPTLAEIARVLSLRVPLFHRSCLMLLALQRRPVVRAFVAGDIVRHSRIGRMGEALTSAAAVRKQVGSQGR